MQQDLNEPTIDDLVIEGFVRGRNMMKSILKTDKDEDLVPFVKVIAALRMLNDDMAAQIGRPVIVRMFTEIGADPTTETGRAKAAKFVDSIALAVTDAANILMQQVQNQMRARQALAQGKGALLRN